LRLANKVQHTVSLNPLRIPPPALGLAGAAVGVGVSSSFTVAISDFFIDKRRPKTLTMWRDEKTSRYEMQKDGDVPFYRERATLIL
jgi:hypothetical protein